MEDHEGSGVVLKAKNTRVKTRKGDGIPRVATLVFVAIVILIVVAWIAQYKEVLDAQKNIESCLEEKYDQDFVVSTPKREGYSLGSEGVLKSTAYPKDDPRLEFSATTSSRGCSDKYPDAFWQGGAADYVKPIIVSVFNYEPNYAVNVVTYVSADNHIKGRLPSFADALMRYGSQMGISVSVTSHETVDSSSKELVAKRTSNLAEKIKSLGLAYVRVEYVGARGGGLVYKLGGPNYPEIDSFRHKTIQESTNQVEV